MSIPLPGGLTEDQLTMLLDFIAGRGGWEHLGGGMTTYPGGDADNRAKHNACLELERRGLIRRLKDEPGSVIWEAV